MNELAGSIRISRRLATHPIFLREPFSAGQCWVDLLLLANTHPTEVHLRREFDKPLLLQRGQVGWTISGLSERWHRSREWISKFLDDIQERGMIVIEEKTTRRMIITIANYDAFQGPLENLELEDDRSIAIAEADKLGAVVTTSVPAGEFAVVATGEPSTETTSVPAGVTTRNRNRSKEREGETRAREVAVPDISEVRAWADMQNIDPDYAEVQWLQTTGNDAWATRTGKQIDWRCLWRARWMQDRTGWIAKRRGPIQGPLTPGYSEKNGGGQSTAQRRFLLGRELAEVKGRLNEAHELDARPDPKDEAREREIIAELRVLDAESSHAGLDDKKP